MKIRSSLIIFLSFFRMAEHLVLSRGYWSYGKFVHKIFTFVWSKMRRAWVKWTFDLGELTKWTVILLVSEWFHSTPSSKMESFVFLSFTTALQFGNSGQWEIFRGYDKWLVVEFIAFEGSNWSPWNYISLNCVDLQPMPRVKEQKD